MEHVNHGDHGEERTMESMEIVETANLWNVDRPRLRIADDRETRMVFSR